MIEASKIGHPAIFVWPFSDPDSKSRLGAPLWLRGLRRARREAGGGGSKNRGAAQTVPAINPSTKVRTAG